MSRERELGETQLTLESTYPMRRVANCPKCGKKLFAGEVHYGFICRAFQELRNTQTSEQRGELSTNPMCKRCGVVMNKGKAFMHDRDLNDATPKLMNVYKCPLCGYSRDGKQPSEGE